MARYVTVDQVAIRMQKLKALSAGQRTMLEEIIEGVSRNIDHVCGREDDGFAVPGAASAKYFAGTGEAHLHISSCTSITMVAVKERLTDITYEDWSTPTTALAGDGDWIPCAGTPEEPDYNQSVYTLLLIDPNGEYVSFINGSGAPTVEVTALWGLGVTVPADIRECCAMQSMRWFKQFQGGGSDDLGNVDYGEIALRRGLDSVCRQILIDGMYIRPLYGGD